MLPFRTSIPTGLLLPGMCSDHMCSTTKPKVKNGNKDLVFELADKRKINKDILKILKKEPYLKRISY